MFRGDIYNRRGGAKEAMGDTREAEGVFAGLRLCL